MNSHLRVLTQEDVPELTSLLVAQAEYLAPWEPARDPEFFTLDKQSELAGQAILDFNQELSVPFLIVSDRDEILGRITLNGIVRGALQSTAIGYWIRSDYAGQGHATHAVSQAIDYAFTALNLHRVQAEVLPENFGSQRVLERNRFQLFGTAPQYLKINGVWRDHLMYQCLNNSHDDV